jgi:AhpD family alkylhydroperoxidase
MQIDYLAADPEVARSLYDGAKVLGRSGLEPNLLALVGIRASQLNGCAFCLALHRREGEALGESGDRLFGVTTWREAPWYSARERAALEWTETLTLVAERHPSEELRSQMLEHFSERELVNLTMAIALVNTYNRFNVGFGMSPDGAEAAFKMLHPQATLTRA